MKVSKILVNPKYMYNEGFDNFLKNLPMLFDTMGRTIYDGRNTIKIFAPPESHFNVDIAIKKYKVPNPIQRVHYTLSGNTKCVRAYINGMTLKVFGFSTPESIAMVETKKNGFFHTGYYVSMVADNEKNLGDLITENGQINTQLADQFAEMLANLHTNGLVFNDLNLTNILCTKRYDGSTLFTLIDTNRMKYYGKKVLPWKFCLADFKSFNGSFEVYNHVVNKYCEIRNINKNKEIDKLIAIKALHNIHYRRKKRFLHGLKSLIT